MSGIFISVSQEDRITIATLEQNLKKKKIPVCIDKRSIYQKKDWPKAMAEAIATYNLFLLVWSEHAATSRHVTFERVMAAQMSKTIIPICLDATPLPPDIKTESPLHIEDFEHTIQTITQHQALQTITPQPQPEAPDIATILKIIDIPKQTVPPKKRSRRKLSISKWVTMIGTILGIIVSILSIIQYVTSNNSKKITSAIQETIEEKLNKKNAPQLSDFPNPPKNDFQHSLDQWSKQYGFTPKEAKEQFDQWARKAKNSDDKRTRALSEFYSKNFEEAALLFSEAAEIQGDDLAAYNNWRDAGNALSEANDFTAALAKYQKAEKIAAQETYPEQWAEINLLEGKAKISIGIHINPENFAGILNEAIDHFQKALTVYKREKMPRPWALIQSNLGTIYWELGMRTQGEQARQFFNDAVRAFTNALEIRTKDEFPQDWAMTQNNLGTVYLVLGMRTQGEQARQFFNDAVRAFKNALEIKTKDEFPQEWAMTQNNLGTALFELGSKTTGLESLQLISESVTAYEKALQVFTKEQFPEDWEDTQKKLKLVRRELELKSRPPTNSQTMK